MALTTPLIARATMLIRRPAAEVFNAFVESAPQLWIDSDRHAGCHASALCVRHATRQGPGSRTSRADGG